MDTTDDRGMPNNLLIGGSIALAVVAVVAFVLIATGGDDSAPSRPGTPPTEEPSPPPAIEQAPWRIETVRAGGGGGLTQADTRRLRSRKPELRALVTDLYDALFLQPERRARALRVHLAPRARRAFAALERVGAPAKAVQLRTLRRRARIGIDTHSTRRAAASVTLRLTGRVGGRRFRTEHVATLWLERSQGRWRVIAFDVRQRPVRR